jgi:fido (protein-threonine AMPylation protein)
VSDLFERPDDAATPLTPAEMRDLLPSHIAYRRELNAAEQENIVRAQEWALSRRRDLLAEKFIKDLHRKMLGDVWR